MTTEPHRREPLPTRKGAADAARPIRVLQLMTRPIIGGSQETALLIADGLQRDPRFKGRYTVEMASGPGFRDVGTIADEAGDRGIRMIEVPQLKHRLDPFNDFRALFALHRLIRDGSYDIVHTNSSKAGILGRIAARWARVPYVVHTVHGWSFHEHMSDWSRRFYVTVEKAAAHYCNRLIVVSPKDQEKGLANGIGRPGNYRLVRSGIELHCFGHPTVPAAETRRALGIPDGRPVVGSVLRMSPQKAPLDLVAAFSHISRTCPDAWFVVVGDGPLRPQVERALEEARIADRTVLTGERNDVPELMAAFDIFVLSSLWEGLPRVLPQAMATRLPIVCTRVDGCADVVSDGINGYLVEPGAIDAMADRVCRLLADAGLRAQMGAEGLARVPEFDASRMVADMDGVYRELLASQTGSN